MTKFEKQKSLKLLNCLKNKSYCTKKNKKNKQSALVNTCMGKYVHYYYKKSWENSNSIELFKQKLYTSFISVLALKSL